MFVNFRATFRRNPRIYNNYFSNTLGYAWQPKRAFSSEFKNFFDLAYPEQAKKSLFNQIYKALYRNKNGKRITSFIMVTIGEKTLYFKFFIKSLIYIC